MLKNKGSCVKRTLTFYCQKPVTQHLCFRILFITTSLFLLITKRLEPCFIISCAFFEVNKHKKRDLVN